MSEQVAAASEAAPAASPKRGGCCGCLTAFGVAMVVLVVALLGAGWLGYDRYLRPWLDDRKEQLYETVPGLEGLVGLVDLVRGSGQLIAAERTGSTRAEDFPPDVAQPGEIERGTYRITQTEALAVLEIPDRSPNRIAARLREEMVAGGWKHSPVSDPQGGIALQMTRDDRIAHYMVLAEGGGSRVWIRVRSARPSAG